ncbi:hypothetical protein [Psychroflexus tropicus]|uniref:hypothetical protein n=1 Tax=Psychroflexus tropicus TaxID=197345 RepID=UPI00035C8FFE|nr:hypothetical protein [Psychroflexus tropicus]
MKAKNKILYFLQEIFIVVIGVIIVVSIGKYKENINNQDYLDKTLKTIENEIEFSQIDLDSVLVRHLKLYEQLDIETYSDEQKTLAEFLLNSGEVQVATTQNVSL